MSGITTVMTDYTDYINRAEEDEDMFYIGDKVMLREGSNTFGGKLQYGVVYEVKYIDTMRKIISVDSENNFYGWHKFRHFDYLEVI